MSTPTIDDETLAALAAQLQSTQAPDKTALAAALDELRALREQWELDEQLRASQAKLMQLTRSKAIGRGDLEQALREITVTTAELLGVARASVWNYSEDRSSLECVELYRADEDLHEAGVELLASDFPRYFEAIARERLIAADDARRDPHTSEFADVYLAPLGISSMLDVPIRVGGHVMGVLCCEHVGPARSWASADNQLASSIADFIALAIESDQRRRIEDELRASIELAEQRLETIERQRMAIADLSAPIIDVWDGVLVLPIIGLVDTQRSLELTERLLERISASSARSVIVDLTGVDVVDTMTANHLLQMIRAAGLLGAFCVLSGISPLIAQTLVQLEVDLRQIATVRSLKEGLQTCIARQNH